MEEQTKLLAPLQPPLYYRDFTFLIGGFFFLLILNFINEHQTICLANFDLVKLLSISSFNVVGNVIVFLVISYFTGMFLSLLGKITYEIIMHLAQATTKPKKSLKKHIGSLWDSRDKKHRTTRIKRLKYLEKHFLVREEYHRIIFQGLTFRILFASSMVLVLISSWKFIIFTGIAFILLLRIDQGIDNIRNGIAEDIE